MMWLTRSQRNADAAPLRYPAPRRPPCHACRRDGYGLIEHGAIGWKDGVIAFVGAMDALPGAPASLAERVESAHGALVTPGLIDCHTHLVFAGDRAREFEMRLQGASYEAIAKAGGGILSSVRATRAASEDELFAQSLPRAQALLRDGVTTLEIKSGYGLDLRAKWMLRVARRIGDELGVGVRTTFLGAHALPPEFAGRADDYIDFVCGTMLPAIAKAGPRRCGRCVLRRHRLHASNRPGACSTRRARRACRSSCMPSS